MTAPTLSAAILAVKGATRYEVVVPCVSYLDGSRSEIVTRHWWRWSAWLTAFAWNAPFGPRPIGLLSHYGHAYIRVARLDALCAERVGLGESP